jgi:expansin (peptidoglycan-binding protein)
MVHAQATRKKLMMKPNNFKAIESCWLMQNGRINTNYQIYNANVKIEIIFKKFITWHNLYYVDEHCNEVLVLFKCHVTLQMSLPCLMHTHMVLIHGSTYWACQSSNFWTRKNGCSSKKCVCLIDNGSISTC